MSKISLRNLLKGFAMLAAALPLASCVDNGYEYADNIDLTMGIEANGLKLNIGNTEKVMLGDLLEIEESGVETDAKGMYYFVENGSTEFSFTLDPISINVPRTNLTSNVHIDTEQIKKDFGFYEIPGIENLPALPHIPVNGGYVLVDHTEIDETENFSTSFTLDGESKDVERINYIVPEDAHLIIKVILETSENLKEAVGLSLIEDLSVTVPSILDLGEVQNEGNNAGGDANANIVRVWNEEKGKEESQLQIHHFEPGSPIREVTVCHVPIERLVIPEDQRDALKTGVLEFSTNVNLKANLKLKTIHDFDLDLNQEMKADVKVYVAINSVDTEESPVYIDSVNGRFNPTVGEVNIDDIKIAEELPDFLQDDDVVIDIKNPTIRFNVDTREVDGSAGIPVSLDFAARIEAIGGDAQSADLKGELLKYTNNILYFHEDPAGPWSPNPLEKNEEGYQDCLPESGSISALIKNVPDAIHVDINKKNENGETVANIQVRQEDYSIDLGRQGKTYEASIDYDVYVPFEFNSDLTVVYNDSVLDISKDLEDVDVLFDGVEVHGSVANTVPLELQMQFIPLNKKGKKINMSIEACHIAAGTGDVNAPVYSDFVAKIKTNGTPLSQLDRIDIRVVAKSGNAGGDLCSNQWLQINKLQLQFLGDVVYDANDY